jgi:hypothetical protein
MSSEGANAVDFDDMRIALDHGPVVHVPWQENE